MITGTDTVVTLTGKAFTNRIATFDLTSNVALTAADGSSVTLTPSSITSSQIAVTIPGTTAPGNYALRAVKGPAESNPVVISVKPAVVITDSSCNRKKGLLTISGSGFSEKVEGTDVYINVMINGQTVDIISWADNQINVSVSRCSVKDTVTVNSLYGSATIDGGSGGKPPKPCKGRGCNK
ncbi:MAG: hypothetical protein GTO60_02795 [Gammaproteobacteria bacterium]|nr:hypothetical protein [Gammaproteobacteria bacterium]